MANETATKSKRFYCVSLIPDICKTPIGSSTPPIPYSVVGEFADATDVSPNVKSRSEPVILHNRSVIPTVKGDERGTAGGIKSGTHGKRVETKTASKTYFSNGKATVQEGCEVWMNNRNTVGKIYERGGIAPRTRLQQIGALLEEHITEATDDTRAALKSAAKDYQDNVSGAMHQFGADTIDTGGKVALGSAALGGAGLAAAATGVGAPVGAVMSAGAVAGGAVGSAVSGVGMAAESLASVLDHAVDYIMTGKTPDLLPAAQAAAERAGLGLLGAFGPMAGMAVKKFPWLGKLFKNKDGPGKRSNGPPPSPPRPPDKPVGGKTSKKKQEKSDKPSSCCPKNAAPGGKPVSSRHPVHFGTGEEVLYQTDFVLGGPIPIAWTRCYRSGSELEDWGLLGARWATPFTASLSLVGKGIVYVDDSGRALSLPSLAPGQSLDHRKEGFVLSRGSAGEFALTWRDGSVDTFVHDATTPDGWLPHGYDGVNAMRAPGAPARAERFELRRSAGRDGRGISVERYPQARPGEVLLRVLSDDGRVLEAMRDQDVALRTGRFGAQATPQLPPRISHIDEVRADGKRICHVRYRYEREPVVPESAIEDAFAALPARFDLVRQTNPAGAERSYGYLHHLLKRYTTYTGFAHSLTWTSLAALRERWGGSAHDDQQLLERFPLTLANSYQARATSTGTADGKDEVHIAYPDGDTTRVTEANGGVLEYTFDANWLATDVRRISPTDAGPVALGRRTWDGDGMLIAESDATGSTTRFSYDAAGNVITSTDALGHASHIEYDAGNQPVAVTDAMGHTTRHTYDAQGRLLTSTDALGHTTSHRYDARGNLVELKDAKGGIKRFTYDAADRLTGYADCSGYRTAYRYNDDSTLAEVTDALDQKTRYDYDPLGRLIAVTQADGARETMAYDADGRLLVHTNALGHATRYAYNGHGLPVERTDALGQTLRYHYDAALQLVELVNTNGESYKLAYHAEGWLVSETGFDGKTTAYTYDSAGQLTASDCRGQRTDLVRDQLGQLLAKQMADSICRYAYDALGRLTAVAAPHAQQRFMFDALGQLVEERSTYFTSPPQESGRAPDAAFVMTHAYDELGNRIQTVLPNGRRIDTLRYGSGHWHGTLWQGRTIVDIERDRLHRETKRQLGAGANLSAARTYDPQSRLTAIALRKNGDEARQPPVRERHFSYDPAGNLTRIEHRWDDSQQSLGTQSYTYDPLGQLLSAVQPGLTELFGFDPAGNLLDIAQAAPATSWSNGQHPAPTKAGAAALAPITHNLLKAYQGFRYAYDEQGNAIRKNLVLPRVDEKDELELAYDTENRLIRAVRTCHRSRHSTHYRYDAFSRRIAKHVTQEKWDYSQDPAKDAPTTTRHAALFVWDGDVMVQELRQDKTVTYLYEPDSFVPLARIESSGGFGVAADASQAGATGAASTCDHIHLPHVAQWDLPAARQEPARDDTETEDRHRTAWQKRQSDADNAALQDRIDQYNCDHLGTPRELIDQQGRVVWSVRYKAWGRVIQEDVHEVEQPLRFQGQYGDAETGLHYNRYRYYDPESARYVTQDPIGLLGGLNGYAYSPNPTGWTDPLGLKKCPKNPTCNPCDGVNPAAWARQWQGHGGYPGRDLWTNTVLIAGTTIYGGAPGQTGFYFDKATLDGAGGSKTKLAKSLQIRAHPELGYRPRVQEYRLKIDTCVATSQALAQDKREFGTGGGTQFFLSDFKAKLKRVGSPILME